MPLIDELDLVHYGLDYLEPEATYVNTFHDNIDHGFSITP